MQIHYAIYFDTADEQWHMDGEIDAYFPDGVVWDHAGNQEWMGLDCEEHEVTTDSYNEQGRQVVDILNTAVGNGYMDRYPS